MQTTELCKQMLNIRAPWRVHRVHVDEEGRYLDAFVDLGALKSRLFSVRLFSLSKQCPRCRTQFSVDGRDKVRIWRHLNVGGMRTYVHVPVPRRIKCSLAECPILQPWGYYGSPFTAAMSEHVRRTLDCCIDVQAACELLDISAFEIEQDERAGRREAVDLDAGPAAMDRSPVFEASAPGASAPAAPATTEPTIDPQEDPQEPPAAPETAPKAAPSIDRVPDDSHPNWEKLIDGHLSIDIKALGLQMMLARIRTFMLQEPDQDQRQDKINELRNYFVKYRRFVQYELRQLFN